MRGDWKDEAMQYRDIDRAIVEKLVPWRVTLNKSRATWSYYTRNPHGGGFGSNYCGPQYIAMQRAIENIPDGAQYELCINGKEKGIQTRVNNARNLPARNELERESGRRNGE